MREMYPREVGKQDEEAGSKDEMAESKCKNPFAPDSETQACWRQLEAGFQEFFLFFSQHSTDFLTDFGLFVSCRRNL